MHSIIHHLNFSGASSTTPTSLGLPVLSNMVITPSTGTSNGFRYTYAENFSNISALIADLTAAGVTQVIVTNADFNPAMSGTTTSDFYTINVSDLATDPIASSVVFYLYHHAYWSNTICCPTAPVSFSSCPSICLDWIPLDEALESIPAELNLDIQLLTCEQQIMSDLNATIHSQLETQHLQTLANLEADYINKCKATDDIDETFTVAYKLGYHHYTLYYYDRAGNLVKTIPPEGVKTIYTDKTTPTDHEFKTEYAYNSLHQLVRQQTPDGGESQFYYDGLGRIIASQNAQQLLDGKFSYTLYDELSRVKEVGVLDGDPSTFDPLLPISSALKRDITRTVYTSSTGYSDLPLLCALMATGSAMTAAYGDPKYTQNRVYMTFNYKSFSYSVSAGVSYESMFDGLSCTYYSYDPHGNVEWMIKYQKGMQVSMLRYEYDLITNNVIHVYYNEFSSDRFEHRYTYDSDKRIVKAETSRDGITWEQDGRYEYYDHGPLKRLVMGEDKNQGLDYTYTLQGWLKAINNPQLLTRNDPGMDSEMGGSHANTARDAFGMVLSYYSGDFQRMYADPSLGPLQSPFNSAPTSATYTQSHFQIANTSLYNGNISSWTYNTFLDEVTPPASSPLFYNGLIKGNKYRYDELNRIKRSEFETFTMASTPPSSSTPHLSYKEEFSYDANGNILKLETQWQYQLWIGYG